MIYSITNLNKTYLLKKYNGIAIVYYNCSTLDYIVNFHNLKSDSGKQEVRDLWHN